MTHVVVTGGSGKLGRACVRDLVEHGYDVINVDLVPLAATTAARSSEPTWPISARRWRCSPASTSDPAASTRSCTSRRSRRPGSFPNAEVFRANTLSTYNVFEAARRLGIKNVVWASSETVLGLPFDTPPPYVPVDEALPGPARRPPTRCPSCVGETMAEQFCRWDPELKIVGLRFSNVMEPEDYARVPRLRRRRARSASGTSGATSTRATARRRSARRSRPTGPGAEVFIIANADTVMSRAERRADGRGLPGRAARGRCRRRTRRCSRSTRRAGCSATNRDTAGASAPARDPDGGRRHEAGATSASAPIDRRRTPISREASVKYSCGVAP